jgi:hypothetical protein
MKKAPCKGPFPRVTQIWLLDVASALIRHKNHSIKKETNISSDHPNGELVKTPFNRSPREERNYSLDRDTSQ